MNESDLRQVLERATDAIDGGGHVDLSARALTGARRRRTRHRGALAAAVVAVLVVVVALVSGLPRDGGDGSPPVSPPTTDVVQARWEPRDVDDLPWAAKDVVPVLPEVVVPPSSADPLAEAPIDAAVLSVDTGPTIHLLSTDGSWRSVPVSDTARASLSKRGTRLLVLTEAGLEVWELPTGERSQLALPDGFKDWDYWSADWVDETTILLDDLAGGWVLDVDADTAVRVPYPTTSHFWWALDDAGALVESADWEQSSVMTDWAGGEPREVDMASLGRLSSLAAVSDTVVGTTYDGRPFSVIVADRSTLQPRAILPVRDFEGNYSNWALQVVGVTDDVTVLLWVAVPGTKSVDGWRLVAWDPGARELNLVSRSDADPTMVTTFATGLLR